MLNFRFGLGQAEIAQNLHSVRGDPGHNLHTVFANPKVLVGELNRLHFEPCMMPRTEKEKAEDRHVDSWSCKGKDGRWTRIHRSGQRALLAPFKVAGGPNAKTPLKKIRITRGKCLASGKTVKIIDDGTTRANAHRLLEGSLIGTTDFREVADYIDDDSDEDQEEEPGKRLAKPLTEDLRLRPGELEKAPKEK